MSAPEMARSGVTDDGRPADWVSDTDQLLAELVRQNDRLIAAIEAQAFVLGQVATALQPLVGLVAELRDAPPVQWVLRKRGR